MLEHAAVRMLLQCLYVVRIGTSNVYGIKLLRHDQMQNSICSVRSCLTSRVDVHVFVIRVTIKYRVQNGSKPLMSYLM